MGTASPPTDSTPDHHETHDPDRAQQQVILEVHSQPVPRETPNSKRPSPRLSTAADDGRVHRLIPAGLNTRQLLPVAALAYALAASGLASHTWLATAAVLAPAVLIGMRADRLRGPRLPVDVATRRTITAWSALLLVGLAWEAWSFLNQPSWNIASFAHPTLSILLDPLLTHRAARVGGWLLWLYAGWRLTDRAEPAPAAGLAATRRQRST